MISVDELVEVMESSFGLKEDKPKSKKHLNFEVLNPKGKRVMNRLVAWLGSKDIRQMLGERVHKHTVKTKSKSEQVDIVLVEDFFKYLQE